MLVPLSASTRQAGITPPAEAPLLFSTALSFLVGGWLLAPPTLLAGIGWGWEYSIIWLALLVALVVRVLVPGKGVASTCGLDFRLDGHCRDLSSGLYHISSRLSFHRNAGLENCFVGVRRWESNLVERWGRGSGGLLIKESVRASMFSW